MQKGHVMAKNTKTKIVEKAETLLWHQGYEGTSLNQVVDKAGVSKGAFFHYYPNKQAISRDVIDKYFAEQIMAQMDKHLTNTSYIKNGLFEWVLGTFETFREHDFKGGCLLGNFALEMADQNEAAREHIKQHFLDWENQLASYLRPLEQNGKLLIERRQLARLLIASLQGVTMMTKVHKDNNRASREFQSIAQLIEYVIKD